MSFKEKFNSISEIVEKNIEEPDDQIIDEIIKKFLAEKRSMSYAFYFIVGYRLPEYIRKRKLCVAFRKVEKEKCKWDDVLTLAGYSERSSFDKAFKKEYESSPAQYLKGARHVKLVEPIRIISVEWNHFDIREQEKSIAEERVCVHNYGGEKMKNNINITKEQDVEKLNKYSDLQALYDLSLSQIMFAEMYCDEKANIYLACGAMEQEYKDMQAEDFTDFYQDCYYITIHCRYSKEVAEEIVRDIRENTLLDVQQLDLGYINAIGQSIATYRHRGLVRDLPYEYFEKIKNAVDAGEDDPDLYQLCSNIADSYKLGEIAEILDDKNREKGKYDVWYIMYQLDMTRGEAEDFAEILNKTSRCDVKEMDQEYLWFLEWYSDKSEWEKWATKMPYDEYVRQKKCVTEEYIYDPSIIEDVLRLALENDAITLEQSIKIGAEESISEAVSTLRKNYVKTISNGKCSPEDALNLLDKYYPDMVPNTFCNTVEKAEKIEKLLLHNPDKWEKFSECDELEFITAIDGGITIEDSKAIVAQRLEDDGISKENVEWEYVYLHEHYFESELFDEDNRWDKRLIPYALYKQIFEYAIGKVGEMKNIWMPELAKIAYELMFNKSATIEATFAKHPYYDVTASR